MDVKQMQKLMNQMGIKSTEIRASKVVIEKEDGGLIEVLSPQVLEIRMQGNTSFQISGEVRLVEGRKQEEEDVKIIMEQTGASKEDAEKALKQENGDLAKAILKLSEERK